MTQNNKPSPGTNPIQVADRIFLVVEALADNGPMRLSDLAETLKLNKTTIHRILNSLICMNYVVQDSASLKYRLTFKICDLANKVLNKADTVQIIHPFLQELMNAAGETVHLVQLEETHAIYIDKLESQQNTVRLVSQLGQTLPLYSSGVGKALLAAMKDEQIKEILGSEKLIPLTPNTITDAAKFMEEINVIRDLGYSIDDEENELGIKCIAAVIELSDTAPQYAFSISAPVYRMGEERIEVLADFVLNTKGQIEAAL